MEEIERIIQQIKNQIHKDNVYERIYQSTDGFSKMVKAIQTTDGSNWTSHLLDEEGQPLLRPEEQEQLKRVIRPHHIQALLDGLRGLTVRQESLQTGGANVSQTNEVKMAGLMGLPVNALQGMKEQAEPGSAIAYDPNHADGMDEAYLRVIKRVNAVNSSVNQFAAQYGVLKLERESDLESDVHLIPAPVSALIASSFPASKVVMDKIKVPFRLIVTLLYLFLDVARLTASLQGEENRRKTLSILVALLEFLRGDWKKALLSFMGYYGSAPLMFGQMTKIYLTMFRMLSPTLQEQIIYGSFDAVKSFLMGVLLAVFKVAAPEEVRAPFIGLLEKVAAKKAEIDGVLTDAGLPPRPAYYSPSFEDMNHLQSMLDDPDFVCSCEYEDLLKQMDRSSMIHLLMQFMRQPNVKELRLKYKCVDRTPCKPFVESLVATGLKQQERESGTSNSEQEQESGTSNSEQEQEQEQESGTSNSEQEQKQESGTSNSEQEQEQEQESGTAKQTQKGGRVPRRRRTIRH